MQPANIEKHDLNQGFTLLELMVVVALIGILATISLPVYEAQILKSKRADAKATLLEMQVEQEKYRANNSSYGTLAQVWNSQTNSLQSYYTLSISNPSATGYELKATGTGTQAQDEQDGISCTNMTLTVNGTTETKSPAACW